MASKGQLIGMRGAYLAAAEFARLGFIASLTSRSAAGADILATTHDCNRAFSVQVKAKGAKGPYFMLGKRAKEIRSKTHFYVLVHIRSKKNIETIDYYIVPAAFVVRHSVPTNPNWTNGFLLHLNKLERYKNNWGLFGSPDQITARRRAVLS